MHWSSLALASELLATTQAEVTSETAKEMENRVIAEIDRALDEHSILLLPDQPMDDNEQVAFTERFGPLEETLPGAVGAGSKVARMHELFA